MKRFLPSAMKYFAAYLLLLVALFLFAGCMTTTPLRTAAEQGDIRAVKSLLDQGADIHEKSWFDLTALRKAAEMGQTDIVRLLLDRGADVNVRDDGHDTPLRVASLNGHTETVKLLLDRGADVHVKNVYGWTALGSSANIEITRMLVEKGANINSTLSSSKAMSLYQELIRERDSKLKREDVLAVQKPDVKSQSAIAVQQSMIAKSDIDELPSKRVSQNNNAYAIVIGIEQYRQKLPKADFAVSDAKLVSEYLSKVMGYLEENIVTITNEHAAKSDFEKYFEQWLVNHIEKDSTLFIYYSGHGAPNPKTGDAYLVPYDGDPAFIAQTGYPLKKLYDVLGKLPAKEIIVALDSCFSGGGGRSVIAKGLRPLVIDLQSNAVLSNNMTVLSASSGEQVSSTYDEKGHGLFTYFMLKGIKNENVLKPDGSIKMKDLFDYIKPQVERIARRQYNNEQTPQLIGHKVSVK